MIRAWARAVAVSAVLLSGCDTITDFAEYITEDANKEKLHGERVSVLGLDSRIQPDPALSSQPVVLPRPVVNEDWPEAGGYASHAMQHLALDGGLKKVWSTNLGVGASRYSRVLAQPVVAGGRIFAMDGNDVVTAFDAVSGKRLWENDVKPTTERDRAYGGGVAVGGDRLFVATGYGQVVALETATGKEVWRQPVAAPLRGPPTVAEGRVFVVTVENELNALSAADGHRLWSHNGIPETAGLLGGASPAVDGDIVVAPYSSGEIFALRVDNGRPVWTDNLSSARRLGALSSLADIRGRPVIDHGRVFAVSHAGRMVAIDLRTGDRVWEQDIGGTNGAWVAGDYLYVLANDTTVVCLLRQDGKVRWTRQLPRYEDEQRKKDPIRWAGPILAGDRLVVIASTGEALSISPYTGKPLGRIEFPDGVFIDPVVANNTLYVVTDNADLIALR